MTDQDEHRPASGDRKRPIFNRSLVKFLALSFFSNLLLFTASPQFQAQQASREITSSQDSVVDEKDVRTLERGNAVKRELSGGQRHSYRIRLSANQFMKAIIEQQGIDVVVRVSGPDGKQILDFDFERRPQGLEPVSLVAEAAGVYQLIVQPVRKRAGAGNYEIRIEELRAATNYDRDLEQSRKLIGEAIKLRLAGKYDEALPVVQRAAELREKTLGPNHRDLAPALNGMAIIYAIKSEYAKAEALYQRSLLITEKAWGPDHPEVASVLNNLGLLYRAKGEYAKAEPLYERALRITEKALGPDDPDVAPILSNLAGLYNTKGEYAKAEPLYERALLIKEKAVGPNHLDIAFLLNNLAIIYRNQGNYAKAESLYMRALDIKEKTLGMDNPSVAVSLNNLAYLYDDRGDYAKAESLYQRALLIREKALGPDHPDVAETSGNLARVYYNQGDYAKAESLYQRALVIKEKVLGRAHADVAETLNSLALIYSDRGDHAKAEPLFQRALFILENAFGPYHPDVAVTLNNLALLYKDKGEYARAELTFRRAQLITEKSLGPDHPELAQIFSNLAVLYAAKGDFAQALKVQSRANTIDERTLSNNLAPGSERQKLAYLALFSKRTDFTLWLQSKMSGDSQAINLAFTNILRQKGRGLDAMVNTIATLRLHATPQDQELFDQLTALRSQVAELMLSRSHSAESEPYQSRIKPLVEKIDGLEAKLSVRSAEFRVHSQPISISAVQAAIPADGVLIEFVTYTPFEPRTGESLPPRYLAYLLASRGQPKWVDLGEAAPIERAVDAWRQSLRENSVDVKPLGRAVDELVMRPVRSSLGSESSLLRRLLIAPDGALNLIPFAALVDEENRYSIERYSISHLTSGVDLLRMQNPQASKSGPLVLANPLFGRMASVATRGSGNFVNSSSDNGAGDPARIFFPPLPGTEGEALAIKALMPEASVLQREKATETVLKQINGPQILHLATHGFFLDYQDSSLAADARLEITSPVITRSASAQVAQFTVQLEATPMLETALVKMKQLIGQGIDAYILKSSLKGKGTFYRVRAGNFLNQAEAQNYGADLEGKGIAGEFFVARYKTPRRDLLEPEATIAGLTTKDLNTTSLTVLPVNRRPTETGSELRLSNFAARVKDPLLRSGLALAGANNGKSGDDDGLLTALEVAGLDLYGTKLVVLSACDTGLGEIKNGEGVQGLRRALVLAGSESQVISLWAVPDELAKDVIIPYYNALRRGEGRGEGLRQVQLRMLRSRNLRHPFYWAAFIQSGEWANLDGHR